MADEEGLSDLDEIRVIHIQEARWRLHAGDMKQKSMFTGVIYFKMSGRKLIRFTILESKMFCVRIGEEGRNLVLIIIAYDYFCF